MTITLKINKDYHAAQFNLTQLSAINPQGGMAYTYWANTGNQQHKWLELSLGYVFEFNKNSILKTVQPFLSLSINDFKYKKFQIKIGNNVEDYTSKMVVGVPNLKYTLGFDFKFKNGLYLQNTFNRMGIVYINLQTRIQ